MKRVKEARNALDAAVFDALQGVERGEKIKALHRSAAILTARDALIAAVFEEAATYVQSDGDFWSTERDELADRIRALAAKVST